MTNHHCLAPHPSVVKGLPPPPALRSWVFPDA